MDATYTAEDSKRKEGSTNEKRCIQSCSNEIQTIDPIFESEIKKREIACPQPPSQREVKK